MFFPWDITRLEYDIGFVMADLYVYIYTYISHFVAIADDWGTGSPYVWSISGMIQTPFPS
jgi:hypothetical protein